MTTRPVFEVDTVVAGAGVVGLAIARHLAMDGRDVLIVEAGEAIGTGNSSRNSEVIHAGLYYPTGSLKARLCVEGKHALYGYLETRGIAHKRLGKLVVATTDSQTETLEALAVRALENGVRDLEFLSGAQARQLEPGLQADAALLSPSTGILDSHGLMTALLGDAEDNGARLVLKTPIEGGEALRDGRTRLMCGGAEPCIVLAKRFVNAAGLGAVGLASIMQGFPASCLPDQRFAKGSYFALQGRAPSERLIYPIPCDGGLGIHLTLDLAGNARFGPDVEWLEQRDPDEIHYDVSMSRAEPLYEAIRTYWPDLPDGALAPGYAGVRPKMSGPGEPNADFIVCGQTEHGLSGQVHLFGIESPGLTACLALARYVFNALKDI